MFVLDTSALVKLVLDEDGSPAFRKWYAANAAKARFAPHLLWSEAGRVLQKERLRLPPADLVALHRLLVATVAFEAVGEAETWAATAGLTLYDAQYVALAKERQATLVTADGPMAEAAKRLKVPVLEF